MIRCLGFGMFRALDAGGRYATGISFRFLDSWYRFWVDLAMERKVACSVIASWSMLWGTVFSSRRLRSVVVFTSLTNITLCSPTKRSLSPLSSPFISQLQLFLGTNRCPTFTTTALHFQVKACTWELGYKDEQCAGYSPLPRLSQNAHFFSFDQTPPHPTPKPYSLFLLPQRSDHSLESRSRQSSQARFSLTQKIYASPLPPVHIRCADAGSSKWLVVQGSWTLNSFLAWGRGQVIDEMVKMMRGGRMGKRWLFGGGY